MLTSRLANHNGQMAIFVALIFQVLFVAFAMVINIGLVVHDKINLQNAVDLAAYYSAQRQAEMLNAIAHQNYQIRQSFKLLAWRYNVLGSAGRDDHPLRGGRVSGGLGGASEAPYLREASLCVAYSPLFEEVSRSGRGDNLCKQVDFRLPQLTVPPVIAAFNPLNIIMASVVRREISRIQNQCRDYGGYNYYLAAAALGAFRLDQANRKEVIRGIAKNMAKPFTEMVDLDGQPVQIGTEKTFRKNLSYENFNSVVDFKTFNSIEGRSPEVWLNEIPIFTTLVYSDLETGGGSGTCATQVKQINTLPNNQGELSSQLIAQLNQLVNGPEAGHPMQLSLGFEKNPWVMIYSGVRATTRPRQIFWPIGQTIEFTAEAYAQPFGGRIGPWYFSQWPRGSTQSSGEKVDKLLPPLSTNVGNISNQQELLPNYSRFPGDNYGLRSVSAQAALPGVVLLQGRFQNYEGILDIGPNTANDILAYDDRIPSGGMIREHEIAAISPDLFDITYYSIDPKFSEYYVPRLRQIRSALGLPDNIPIRGDLGTRTPDRESFNVREQVAILSGSSQGQTPKATPNAFWFIRNVAHLLTGWVHNDSFEVIETVNRARFGSCEKYDDDFETARVPGSCVAGGRTGYSVKIISKDYLMSQDLQLGGDGQTGGIINPPPPSN